jgi:hypothetical protein
VTVNHQITVTHRVIRVQVPPPLVITRTQTVAVTVQAQHAVQVPDYGRCPDGSTPLIGGQCLNP